MKYIFNRDFIDFFNALNNARVRYLLVGGYAVVLHGYNRTTGDLDIWVEQTRENYQRLMKAFAEFKIPLTAIEESDFLGNTGMDVFTLGRPPVAIDIMTSVKGLDFHKAYALSGIFNTTGVQVRLLDLNSLIVAKAASGRHKDLDDIEHLTENKE
jgi:hypothetical protein